MTFLLSKSLLSAVPEGWAFKLPVCAGEFNGRGIIVINSVSGHAHWASYLRLCLAVGSDGGAPLNTISVNGVHVCQRLQIDERDRWPGRRPGEISNVSVIHFPNATCFYSHPPPSCPPPKK